MSVPVVDLTEENNVETRPVECSVSSLVNVDAVGTFELEHDLLFETENISAAPTGVGSYVVV